MTPISPFGPLTPDMVIVFGFLMLVVLLFVSERVRVDMVGLLMMSLLPLSGVIAPGDALIGLSSNAVVSIIAVIIIGHGLDKTGVMNILARQIVKLSGKSRVRMTSLISSTVALISSFMQNIGAAALFLPAVGRMCRQLNVPISQVLIPMGYCAVIGGCITLIGSSPLILLNDLMATWWKNHPDVPQGAAFGLFDVTPLGIGLLISAVLYFALMSKWVLPKSKASDETNSLLNQKLESTYGHEVNKVFEFDIPNAFYTRRLEELELRPKYHATVVCISKHNGKVRITEPGRGDVVEHNDVIGIVANESHAQAISEELGWTLKPELEQLNGILSTDQAGITEAIVTPRSELVGRTFHDYGFRRKLKINPLALYRRGKVILENISEIRIQPGDAFLLHGEWEKFHLIRGKNILTFTEQLQGEIVYPEKALHAVFSLLLALVMAIGFNVQLSIALLCGAVSMILSRVMDLDEAYASVDWMTVFLLAGLIPLGVAFEQTGAAALLAQGLANLMDKFLTPFTLFLLMGGLTSFFTLVISNVGATILMVPLAMNMAVQCGADPRIAALLVAVAASNTFILPTHQVNALIMRPGGYKVKDYVLAGSGMSILFIIVTLGILQLFYGMAM